MPSELPSGALRRRAQTYDDDRVIGTSSETPWVTDLLRLFECTACCSDRSFDDADFKSGLGRDLWDQEEEPIPLAGSSHFAQAETDEPAPSAASLPEGGFPVSPLGQPVVSHPTPAASAFDHFTTAHQAAAEPEVGEQQAVYSPLRLGSANCTPGLDARELRRETSAYSEEQQLEERPSAEVEGGYLYTGQWRGSQRHGQGVLERTDGVRYVGTFVGGCAHGRGIFTGADGSAYDGEWDAEHMHGYGKYVDVDGSTYEGEWGQDSKSGRGIECYSDGARYEGEFWMGGKHGAGIYRSGTGVEYEGQYAHDRMDGEGRYKFADGRAYSGQWAVGHMQGFGKMSWPNGSKYEGGYQQDKKHGEGSFTWPDGRMYAGQWRNGQLDGTGVLIDLDGQEEDQAWINGQRVVEAVHTEV